MDFFLSSMKTLSFDKSALQNLEWSLKHEWLETNGLGGYASSTVMGANTRRYHGLLVAAMHPPRARFVLLSHLEEALFIGDRKYEISTNIYSDVVHPRGYQYLVKFLLSPFPTFIFQIEDVLIEKSVFMIYGEHTTVVSYRLLAGEAEKLRLEVRPKLAYRDFHSFASENPQLNSELTTQKGLISLTPYSQLPPIHFYHDAVIVDKSSYWFKRAVYPEERERGFDSQEDLFSPCALIYTFLKNEQVYLAASTQIKENVDVEEFRRKEESRRARLEAPYEISKEEIRTLWRSSDTFLVKARDGLTRIIAGYHWFEDWGRDTFISLPGLALATGRYEIARDLLLAYSDYVSQGMIPNRFPDQSETPEYHSLDASLWYVNAAYEYFVHTEDDRTLANQLYPILRKIMKYYKEGTRFDIHMDADGLIEAGNEKTHLTWMDVAFGDSPVTSRHGKAVEINALWYNALKIMEFFAGLFKDEREAGFYRDLAFLTKESFNERFWDRQNECLYDVVRREERDDSIRPNQIFSFALPFPVLAPNRWKSVLKKVDEELLTPAGLRSLSPNSPEYRGVYAGGPVERDKTYHQGAVWPWLIGPYVFASLRAYGRTKPVKLRLLKMLDQILARLEDACLGYISEIFDGDSPHQARGAIAQAWNAGEILRAYVELVKDELKIEKAREFVLR